MANFSRIHRLVRFCWVSSFVKFCSDFVKSCPFLANRPYTTHEIWCFWNIFGKKSKYKFFQKKELPLGNIESRDQWKSINTRSILSKAALRGLEKETTNKNEENIHQGRKRGCQSNNINQELYYRNSQGCRNSIGESKIPKFTKLKGIIGSTCILFKIDQILI